MDTLTRRMREAAELAPERLDTEPAGHTVDVWRQGRRRHHIRAMAHMGGVLGLLAVVAALVLGTAKVLPDALLPADGGTHTGVTAYPQRLGHQWWVSDLDDRSDPVAAIVQVVDVESGEDEWQALSARGERRRLQGSSSAGETFPAVSPNGERVAYLQMPENRWVIRDLRQGTWWTFPKVRMSSAEATAPPAPGAPYAMAAQSPAVFSPSGDALALLTLEGPIVIDTTDGSVREVVGMDQAAGWVDDDRLVGRSWGPTPSPVAGDTSVDITVWSRSTARTDVLGPIDLDGLPLQGALDSQRWGTVRADRTLWVATTGEAAEGRRQAGVSLPDLRPVDIAGDPAPSLVWYDLKAERTSTGATAWRDTQPVTFVDVPDGRQVQPSLDSVSTAPITVVEPSTDVHRIIWADDALNGSPSFTLFGTSTAWWAWWWKEIALVVLGIGVLVRWRRRRHTSVAE